MDEALDSCALASICQQLSPRELAMAGCSCSALASVCRSNALWRPFLEQKYDFCIQTQSCRSLDLQSTYRQLAAAPASHALRFAAVYTDGGCDGMVNGDLTYWADHAFQPNHWSPHCSDGKADIHIAALLQLPGVSVDVALARHRAYLISRCAPAAAVLFSPHGAPQQGLDLAQAKLCSWSSVGLERLFMDLYQDLVQQQQASTWGRLLLQDVPREDIPAELARLTAAAAAISQQERGGLYSQVRQVPEAEVLAAATAAAAKQAAGVLSSQLTEQHDGDEEEVSTAAVSAGDAGQPPAAAASTGSDGLLTAAAEAAAALPAEQGGAGVHAAAAGGDVSAADKRRSGSGGGNSLLGCHCQQQQQQQAQVPQAVASSAHHVSLTPQQVARHMVDCRLLDWFDQPGCTQATALVRELVVSRVGHFTCPVQSAAILLGQQPTTPAAAGSAGSAAAGSGSSPEQQQRQQPELSSSSQPGLRQVLLLKHDPIVAALNGASTAAAVLAAVAAGVLPPLLRHHKLPGAEWVEFAPLGRQQRAARAAAGWHLRPVVWFRFDSAPQPADNINNQQQQQQQPAPPAAAAAAVAEGMDADGTAAAAAAPANGSELATVVGMEVEADDDSDSVQGGAAAAAVAAAAAGQGAAASAGYGDDEDMFDELGDSSLPEDDGDDYVMHEADSAAAAAAEEDETGGFQQQQQQPQRVQAADAPAAAAAAAAGAAQMLQQSTAAVGPQQQQPAAAPVAAAQHSGGGARRPEWRAPAGSSAGVSVAAPPAGVFEACHDNGFGAGHLVLRMELEAPRCGNMVLVKLISCEDRMTEYEDSSEEPNIDVQYVALRGVGLHLTQRQLQLL